MDAKDQDCDVVEEHGHFYAETDKDRERISIRLGERGNKEARRTQIQPIQNDIKQIHGVNKERNETKYVLYDGLPS